MGKFKGSKSGSRSNDDQGGEDALQRVLANGYASETDRGLLGRQGRRKMGPVGRLTFYFKLKLFLYFICGINLSLCLLKILKHSVNRYLATSEVQEEIVALPTYFFHQCLHCLIR